VVTERARFRLPEASMGLFPAGLTATLTTRMTPRQVADLILTGRTVSAAEALRTGLATVEAEPAKAEEAALALLTAATRPARAVVTETLAWLSRAERGGTYAD
jgi:enoyl-CoA hydratase/carnithine racemase